jgi:hypothetical protein
MIYFQSISENVNAEDYLSNRLEKFLSAFPHEQRSAVLHGFANPDAGGVTPHFIPAGALDGAPEAIAAAKDTVEESFPLASGERVESEELYTLLTNGSDLGAALLFLRQKTSFAQTFMQIPGRVALDGRIVASSEIEPRAPVGETSGEIVAVVPVWALALAKELGQKLLQMAGTAVWDAVRKQVLKQTDLPTYFEEVYAEMRQIVASAFQASYLKEVKDLAEKFALTMDYYNNMGKKETDFLIVKNTSFDLITKSNTLGSPGAFHYAEATILHIMTLQEGYKRLVAEGAKPEDLVKAKDYIAEMAIQFAFNVKAKHKALLAERLATISSEPFAYYSFSDSPQPGRTIGGVREAVYDSDGTYLYSCAPVQNMFKDNTNGFWNSMYFNVLTEAGAGFKHSWTWVNNNLQSYKKAIESQTLEELSPLLDVVERLKNIAHPISS